MGEIMNKFLFTSILAVCLLAPAVQAAEGKGDVFQEMEAAAERIRQSGEQFRAELKKAREERLRLQKKQEAERKQEEERERQQAEEDAARLAAIKSAQERKALELAQEKARKEIRVKAEQAEQARKSALENLQVNELAAHQAAISTQEMTREERMARARAVLAQARAEAAQEARAFEETKKSEQDLIMEKASRAQAALLQIRQDKSPKAFDE